MEHLHTHWTDSWHALQLQPPADLYAQLLQAYAQPQRHYHTLQHLSECLALWHDSAHLTQQPGEVAVALWWHDAIYDVQGSLNEARSAEWALNALQATGAAPEVAARVHALIMATQHSAAPQTADQQLLVDIDLAILGAAPARFAAYEQQIEQEYAWVPPALFTQKRQAILQNFLARPHIYSTAFFHQKLEATARRNLHHALQHLASLDG